VFAAEPGASMQGRFGGIIPSMQVLLQGDHDHAHSELLELPGAYEWWYFDAVSDDREYSFVSIWFIGNPFSPYYRLSALNLDAYAFDHSAVFFALYKKGALDAYHFTRIPRRDINLDGHPLRMTFGPNILTRTAQGWRLILNDENGNRRRLAADLLVQPPFAANPASEVNDAGILGDDGHFWQPAMPYCRVSGHISRIGYIGVASEDLSFSGVGYQDHNWGKLPFKGDTREWYWARLSFDDGLVAVLYCVRHGVGWQANLLVFAQGRCILSDNNTKVELGSYRINAFGLRHSTEIKAASGNLRVVFSLRERVDSAPFYIRFHCAGRLEGPGRDPVKGERSGAGFAEYFRPGSMAGSVTASAMKARIVDAEWM